MEDSQLTDVIEPTSKALRAVAPGIRSALGLWIGGGQTRKNLEADQNFISKVLEAGHSSFRYEGAVSTFDIYPEREMDEIRRELDNLHEVLKKADSVIDESKVDIDKFSPEFRRRWIQEASNVSDEDLQGLWAQLLKGELESPGTVSNDTLSIARDLTKERAAEFQILCSMALIYMGGDPMMVAGCGSPGDGSLRSYGLPYSTLMKLAHHRLISSEMDSRVTFDAKNISRGLIVLQGTTLLTMRWVNSNDPSAIIRGILFTPAGEELFRVVEKIHIPGYLEAMIETLEGTGWDVYGVHPSTAR